MKTYDLNETYTVAVAGPSIFHTEKAVSYTHLAPKNGWYLVECDQHAAGWGKLVNGTLKNFFPKGLRF